MVQQTLERPPESPRRRSRRPAFFVGLVMLVAGLGLLGYVGWQFFGTNVVAHHQQQQIVSRTERAWSQSGSAGASASTKGLELHGAQALVHIPRFGKDYLVPVQQGISTTVLAQGFGHFPGTARAGQVGNFAIAAHRITHGEPLRGMPDLRPGDHVVVETSDATYTYVLDTNPNHLVVTFRDVWVIDGLPHNPLPGGVQPAQRAGQHLLTMTTCSELFHTDNRMIVFGHLVRTVRR